MAAPKAKAGKPKCEKPFEFISEAPGSTADTPKRPAQAHPKISDEVLRLRALRLVLEYGCHDERKEPFKKATEIFNFVRKG